MKAKKILIIITLIMLMVISFTSTISTTAASSNYSLNRIGIMQVQGAKQFYDTVTSEKIRPEGYNYTQIDINYQDRAVEFNVGRYVGYQADKMLSEMQHYGENTIRVFIDHGSMTGTLYGVGGPPSTNTQGLYAPYMNNFLDFLNRAKCHNIYVIPVLTWIPQNYYYVSLIDTNLPNNVEDVNSYLLSPNGILAKQQYLHNFVTYIKNYDSTLLSTILAYETDNEFFVLGNKKPFSLRSGTVTPANGNTYDMSDNTNDAASRQKCYDDSMVYYCNALVTAIKGVDPKALVMLGMFTYNACGRPDGPNGVAWNTGEQDTRFPPSPQALATSNCKFDVIDIHLYPFGQTITTDLNSDNWSSTSKAYQVFLMGEFGAFKSQYPTTSSAASAMTSWRSQAYANGFGGSLFWTWNDCGQSMWAAQDGNKEIRDSLARGDR